MKVVIVGAGAMGSLFASYLARILRDLWVYDIWQEHIDAINKEGLLVVRGGEEFRICLKATCNPNEPGIVDLVIFLVKYIHTCQAVQDAAPMIGPGTAVLTLQNGIGNVEILQEVVPAEQILLGLTTLPSELLGPGRIEDSCLGQGDTYFWPLVGEPDERAKRICSIFNEAGIHTEISPDIHLKIWKKLVVNCGPSALAAITRLKAGDLAARAETWPILECVVSEIVEVAQRKGIPITKDEAGVFLRQVIQEGLDHVPSMLADILKKRKTEVECLNWAVVLEGQKLGIPTPVNQILFYLIRIIEETHDRRLG